MPEKNRMEDIFTLTVPYKGQDREYEGQLFLFGYRYRIRMWIDGVPVDYERDEEGAFRATVPDDADQKAAGKLDRELLAAIAQQLEAVLA